MKPDMTISKKVWLVFGAVFALAAAFPFLNRAPQVSEPVRAFYRQIDSLPPGTPVLLSLDFAPSFRPELEPMAEAVCAHIFRKNLRLIGLSLVESSSSNAQEILHRCAARLGMQYGRDYVFLGWQPADIGVITGMGSSIKSVFPADFRGTDISPMPVMQGVASLKDFPLLVQIGAGFQSFPAWVAYAGDKFRLKILIGCNAGAEPSLRPFFASRQLAGFMPSIRGAAEYERLSGEAGRAARIFNSISPVQFGLAVALLLLNLPLLFKFRKK